MTDTHASQLRELHETVTKLRNLVLHFASLDSSNKDLDVIGTQSQQAISATSIIAANDRRAKLFGNSSVLFGDPAWTILLELYIADSRGQRFSISDAATCGGVAPSTGLRLLVALEQRGLVRRESDIDDGRRSFVFLTEDAKTRISTWLASV